MITEFHGKLTAEGLRVGIVVARFNDFVTSKLLEGSKDCFIRHGGQESDLTVAWVPGAFEIPLALKKLAKQNKYDALVAIGAVIRGSTSHYDYVCSEVAKGVSRVSDEFEIPVMFGVLTTDNIEQALERSGIKHGNKGWETTLGAIEMANLLKAME